MSDFDFRDPPNSDGEESGNHDVPSDQGQLESAPEEPQTSFGSGSDQAPATPGKRCFVSGCAEVSGKRKFCIPHQKIIQSMLSQAKRADKEPDMMNLLSDPVMVSEAIRLFTEFNAAAPS